MNPPLAERILDKLRAAPFSPAEIAFDLGERVTNVSQVERVINSLLRDGAVVKLEGRQDEGRAIYALANYVEETAPRAPAELFRDYSMFYERPDVLD